MASLRSPWLPSEVVLQLHVTGPTGYFPKDLIGALEVVDETLKSVENELVMSAVREFHLDDQFVITARAGLAALQGRRVVIKKAFGGSIVLEAAVAGAALLIIRYTIMESVKGGWTKTEVHSKIEQFIRNSTDVYGDLIAKQCSEQGRRAKVYYRLGRKVVRLKIAAPNDGDKTTIGNLKADHDSLLRRLERYWEAVKREKQE